MKRPLLVLLFVCVRLSAASPPHEATPQPADTHTVRCTFTNPAYSGLCTVSEVTPRSVSAKAACRRILTCLNSSRCITKTYCNATSVRGGWRLVTSKGALQGAR